MGEIDSRLLGPKSESVMRALFDAAWDALRVAAEEVREVLAQPEPKPKASADDFLAEIRGEVRGIFVQQRRLRPRVAALQKGRRPSPLRRPAPMVLLTRVGFLDHGDPASLARSLVNPCHFVATPVASFASPRALPSLNVRRPEALMMECIGQPSVSECISTRFRRTAREPGWPTNGRESNYVSTRFWRNDRGDTVEGWSLRRSGTLG